MTEQQFEKFKEKWYQENPQVPYINTRNMDEDVINDMFREIAEEIFDILKKYNNEIEKKDKQVKDK